MAVRVLVACGAGIATSTVVMKKIRKKVVRFGFSSLLSARVVAKGVIKERGEGRKRGRLVNFRAQ